MACIQADGTLTDSARQLLSLLVTPLTAEAIAERTGRPLYLVRAGLREMGEVGLVALQGERWGVTTTGEERVVGRGG